MQYYYSQYICSKSKAPLIAGLEKSNYLIYGNGFVAVFVMS